MGEIGVGFGYLNGFIFEIGDNGDFFIVLIFNEKSCFGLVFQ